MPRFSNSIQSAIYTMVLNGGHFSAHSAFFFILVQWVWFVVSYANNPYLEHYLHTFNSRDFLETMTLASMRG
jgi:hypothetical protein